ncbi:PREDICTED: serine hydrolase-like protein 2 [Papilio polytes]|uniref:serine hydrolase-like protein 2 n=1 Tax=Papilio polytes TaxID=76194 RepID=UPI0006766A5D|nr:PREDICTED: serine hydrolase-like protein 2 [Papilio polytes]
MSLVENEWFIQAPWGKICIVAWGDCMDPPVLVCHGNIDSAASFRPLISLLPKKFYYVGMELPGNGKSDPFPPGVLFSSHDILYSIVVVVRHFRWEKFIYLAHSFGSSLGKMYAMAFPDKLTKIIELDPITVNGVMDHENYAKWYQRSYHEYVQNYKKYNLPKEYGPKYKHEEAVTKLIKNRHLTKETAEATLERWSEPTGDGHIRFTFDQRLKIFVHYQISEELAKKLYTNIKIPTLAILTDVSIDRGLFKTTPFFLDEKAYPAGNYRFRIVSGYHDVHVVKPEILAPYVCNFLLYGLQGLDNNAKL